MINSCQVKPVKSRLNLSEVRLTWGRSKRILNYLWKAVYKWASLFGSNPQQARLGYRCCLTAATKWLLSCRGNRSLSLSLLYYCTMPKHYIVNQSVKPLLPLMLLSDSHTRKNTHGLMRATLTTHHMPKMCRHLSVYTRAHKQGSEKRLRFNRLSPKKRFVLSVVLLFRWLQANWVLGVSLEGL